jgi:lipopolysaccharide biosynthesis protein|tara:strand:- start:99 stop:854 length:756 start_codon:yes stop_codon:yes gene_type:complete
MKQLRKALVVAHFNRFGKIRQDTISALIVFNNFFDRIILVSTNLNEEEKYKIPNFIETFVRKNVGYDFYSYRYGIRKLLEEKSDWQITLMNTSFVIIDPDKLYIQYIQNGIKKDNFEFYGLTKSNERKKHIQSFMMTFSNSLVQDNDFVNWWNAMIPLNVRQEVIDNYEIGLSQYLICIGYKLKSAFSFWDIFSKIKNPTHAKYEDLLHKFGVLKIEVFKDNPFNLNLDPIKKLIDENNKFKKIINEGLNN